MSFQKIVISFLFLFSTGLHADQEDNFKDRRVVDASAIENIVDFNDPLSPYGDSFKQCKVQKRKLRTRVRNLRAKNRNYQQVIDDLKAKVSSLESTVARLQGELALVHSENHDLNMKNASLSSENFQLKMEMTQMQFQIDRLGKELEAGTCSNNQADLQVSLKDPDSNNVVRNERVPLAEIELDAGDSKVDVYYSAIELGFASSNPSIDIGSELSDCAIYDGETRMSDYQDASDAVWFDAGRSRIHFNTIKNLEVYCETGTQWLDRDSITITLLGYEAEGANGTVLSKSEISESVSVTFFSGSVEIGISSSDLNNDKAVAFNSEDVALGDFEIEAEDADFIFGGRIEVVLNQDTTDILSGKIQLVHNRTRIDLANVLGDKGDTYVFEHASLFVEKDHSDSLRFLIDADDQSAEIKIESVIFHSNDPSVLPIVVSGVENAPVIHIVRGLPVVTQVDVSQNIGELFVDSMPIFVHETAAGKDDLILGNIVYNIESENYNFANTSIEVSCNGSIVFDSNGGVSESEISVRSALMNMGASGSIDVDLSSVLVVENDVCRTSLVSDLAATGNSAYVMVRVQDGVYSAGSSGINFSDVDLNKEGNQVLDGSLLLDGDMKSLIQYQE